VELLINTDYKSGFSETKTRFCISKYIQETFSSSEGLYFCFSGVEKKRIMVDNDSMKESILE